MPKEPPSFKQALEELAQQGSAQLQVHFGATTVSEPGTKLTKKESSPQPTLSLAAPAAGKKYIAALLDLDGPYPSFRVLSPVLHSLQADLAPGAAADGFAALEAGSKPLAPWMPPSPPPPTAPHRYVHAVWEQPEGLSKDAICSKFGWKNEVGLLSRMRWDQEGFEKKLGLGKPVAVNYFLCN